MKGRNNNHMKQYGNIIPLIALAFGFGLPCLSLGAGDIIIPEKTKIALQLNNHLSTKVNREGDSFSAVVVEPVYQGDRIVIPKGSVVEGSISRIVRPGRFKGKAVMNLLFQSINIPGRGQLPIVASLARVDPEASPGVRSEGGLERENSVGKDAGRVLAPGLAGAGIGALRGGGKGAGIGAGVGAAIGLATVFATRGRDLEVHRGSTMDLLLDKPLVIPQDGESAVTRNR
ncbi:MAG: hypothetical protein ABIN58_09970 [candidate division WOR-3 bacterium]